MEQYKYDKSCKTTVFFNYPYTADSLHGTGSETDLKLQGQLTESTTKSLQNTKWTKKILTISLRAKCAV